MINIRGTILGGAWSAPSSPATGDMWIATGTIYGAIQAVLGDGILFNGSSWTNIGMIQSSGPGPVGPPDPPPKSWLRANRFIGGPDEVPNPEDGDRTVDRLGTVWLYRGHKIGWTVVSTKGPDPAQPTEFGKRPRLIASE